LEQRRLGGAQEFKAADSTDFADSSVNIPFISLAQNITESASSERVDQLFDIASAFEPHIHINNLPTRPYITEKEKEVDHYISPPHHTEQISPNNNRLAGPYQITEAINDYNTSFHHTNHNRANCLTEPPFEPNVTSLLPSTPSFISFEERYVISTERNRCVGEALGDLQSGHSSWEAQGRQTLRVSR
jgi:hypothetical protein